MLYILPATALFWALFNTHIVWRMSTTNINISFYLYLQFILLSLHRKKQMFSCNICGRAFNKTMLLIAHLKILHGYGKNSTFSCTQKCGQLFQNIRAFKKHITNCTYENVHKHKKTIQRLM